MHARQTRLPVTTSRVALVMGVLFLGTNVATAHGDGHKGTVMDVPESGHITVVGKEFQYSPSRIHVEKGQHVTLVFKNAGALSHNLTIPKLGLKTETIQGGATDTIEFTAKKAATYPFWCTVPGHKQAGMTGGVEVGG
ncbi:cupredoxin domain-containing protein [Arhodomonas aquaeolei]|uniref:cupredoxin domain-containing protein n=1 Tax=Arhodomonas aquaeolei TaxID=2369 RepID=UPI00037676E7|nr:cupredoxin domain-containing protein [Arhodomonas aquaeolei]